MSTANPIQLDPSIPYPDRWTSVEYACKKCGVEVRVDCEIDLAAALQKYKHCFEDEGRLMPGPIIASFEKKNGEWVLTGKPR
jgi:hypothetical protein